MGIIFKSREPVEVRVDGVTCYVRPLTAGGLAKLLHNVEASKAAGTPWATDFDFVSASVLDADGNRIFASADEVAEQHPVVVAELLQHCLRVNGVGQVDEKKVSSETTPPSSPCTASPSPSASLPES